MKSFKYNYLKILFSFIFIGSFFDTLNAQGQLIKLEDAILLAQKKSFEFKVAFNRYQSNLWVFENYKASFLPTIVLNGTIPDYSHSISRIILPSGDYAFVSQNQAYSSLNLGVKQNVIATGGIVSMHSSLDRIDIFGPTHFINYSTVPFSLSYSQDVIGFNDFKWQKKTEPLRFESAKRELLESMQQISLQTVTNYFNMVSVQMQQSLSKQNLANADTLSRIAKDRFKLGTVTQNDLLQLRLSVLNGQKQLREDSINYVLARQQFMKYLVLSDENWLLEIPSKLSFFEIKYQVALEEAKKNSQVVTDYKLKRLEAERALSRTKAESGLKFNIQANFGMSNSSPNFKSLYNNLANQQNIALGFSLPILDWGYNKTRIARTESNLAMVKSEIEQGEMELEQTIYLYTLRWNLHQRNVTAAIEAKEIADQNYELGIERYKSGNISIYDLNSAQNQKDNANNAYMQSVKTYWEMFYTIRQLTLYDFEKNEKISIGIINSNEIK